MTDEIMNLNSDDSSRRSEIAAAMRKARMRNRGHADFFRGASKESEELFIASLLMTYLNRLENVKWQLSLQTNGQDPPDCAAESTDGCRLAIEVTELVDQTAIQEAKRHGTESLEEWDLEQLTKLLRDRIDRKDRPSEVHGGPYDSYVLVFHTDEPALSSELLKALESGPPVSRTSLLTAAFIVVSFEPRLKKCPVVEVPLQVDGSIRHESLKPVSKVSKLAGRLLGQLEVPESSE